MEDYRPVIFVWTDDGVMKPRHNFTRTCDKQFVVGMEYRLVVEEERSMPQHRRYFACLNEAWRNLPYDLALRFPTAESLRKWVLIKCNYANAKRFVYESPLDAAMFANYIEQEKDDSVVVQDGRVITVYTAKSQSNRHMNKEEFQKSSNDVLDYVAAMISTSRADLEANADRAA